MANFTRNSFREALNVYSGGCNKIVSLPSGSSGPSISAIPDTKTIYLHDITITDSAYYLFSGLNNIKNYTSMDLTAISFAPEVKSFIGIFSGLNNVQNLDASTWDTSNVIYMQNAFLGFGNSIGSGRVVNIQNWNTSNVINMSGMFSDTKAEFIFNFNTINVTDMSGMFRNYYGYILPQDIISWDTSNVNTMFEMFYGTHASNFYVVSGLDTQNTTNMGGMFSRVTGVNNLDLSTFDVTNVKDMSEMFSSTISLNTLDLSNWDTANVTSDTFMFYDSGVKSIIYDNSNLYSIRNAIPANVPVDFPYQPQEERLVVKGSERITRDLQVNQSIFVNKLLSSSRIKTNKLDVKGDATINNYDVATFTIMQEDDYNNLSEPEKTVFYFTQPSGNLYFQGYGYSPSFIPTNI